MPAAHGRRAAVGLRCVRPLTPLCKTADSSYISYKAIKRPPGRFRKYLSNLDHFIKEEGRRTDMVFEWTSP